MVRLNKNHSFFAYIVSFIVLALFLLLGLILVIFFIQNMFISIKGFGLMQVLFFLIGIYLVYKPIMHIKFLIVNKKSFDKIFNNFIKANKKALIITAVLSIILLFLFYSSIYLNFDFFVNAALYLPIFLLNNLIFIANIFLLKYKLMFLAPVMGFILPVSQILYLFFISRTIAKFLKYGRTKEKL